MIELIFVIVVLGILASVAVPRFFPVVEDAYIAKAQAKVSVIRSGLQNWRSLHLLKGDGGAYPSSIDDDSDASKLFCKVTTCETNSSAVGKWSKKSNGEYLFHLDSYDIVFDYNSTTGSFDCVSPSNVCDRFE